MKKKLLVVLVALLTLLVGAAALLFVIIAAPAYQPGKVRAARDLGEPLAPPEAGSQTDNYWQVAENVRLFHFARGQGEPVLVVHGGPGYPVQSSWPGLDLLSERHRFVYYHQRGCGRSTRPIERFAGGSFFENQSTLIRSLGLAAQIADIERIRQILGREQLTLVGHSFGGFIAALYAAEFPERVRALVLVAPANLVVFPADDDSNLFAQVRERLPAPMRPEYDAYVEQLLDYSGLFEHDEKSLAALNRQFVRYYLRALRGDHARPQRALATDGSGMGGFVQPAVFMSMGFSHDYSDALRPVQAPVLVLHGANDLQPEKASRAYTTYFDNAQLKVIEDAGHFVCEEQPQACADAVGAFLATLG